jgi:choline transport protein
LLLLSVACIWYHTPLLTGTNVSLSKSDQTVNHDYSMATACIVLLYISYSIPILCLLLRGRDNIKHGPFWLGKYGFLANIVLLCWTAFTLVMYSLPYTIPVHVDNMNYVSLVYAVVCAIVAGDWFLRGRREYRGQETRRLNAELEVR